MKIAIFGDLFAVQHLGCAANSERSVGLSIIDGYWEEPEGHGYLPYTIGWLWSQCDYDLCETEKRWEEICERLRGMLQ